ncbi:hypothetical protein BCR35DRAFT_308358 [Leucosporidium creatinivorum]|uniref:Transcription factor n=1 Tax=Leucosporidium creatinivorum TaxID=106004 RepID=A0A1Y2E5S9_9BASI|nr:hypothetical protein BCR35DRAFT_308358 [Leucosporidium creatinivorum]
MNPPSAPPVQLYKATYSSVPVYEFPCQGVAVMRRKSDGWLNATQILKVAGFDKPQRTRVLEREVQKGTHEKVQGGYGKYQGTWVPMDRGIALSRQYGVDRLLQPIFDFVPTADSPPLAPKHITAPATRPKKKNDIADGEPGMAMKAQRAAQNKAAAAAKRAAAAESRRLAEEALEEEEESEEEFLLPAPRGGGEERGKSPTPSERSETSETPSPLGSEVDGEYQASGAGRSKKRKLQDDSGSMMGGGGHHGGGAIAGGPGGLGGGGSTSSHAQLGQGSLRYARMILDYFVSESTQVPQFLVTPPADFDANVVIDDDGHTALHWACAMGRIRIVKLLLSAGADIFRANSMGQTALMRSVMFTNNYDLRKFPELFELLHRSTINIDRNDRTVFHYIVDIALQKGKTHAARYYIETVLARLVDYPKEVADILNFQDEEGETALTLAARARSKRLVKILLDNGADPKIANRDGKTAEDYILEDERFRETEAAAIGGAGGVGGAMYGGGVPGLPPLGSNGGPSSDLTNGSHLPHLPSTSHFPHQQPQPHHLPLPQLHTSESGQRITTKYIPLMSSLLESLAHSFDAELLSHDRDLSQASSLLSNIQSEILDNQRTAQQLEAVAAELQGLDAREMELRLELENKMGKRFRLGWEKWVRDEDAREQSYEAELERQEKGEGGGGGPSVVVRQEDLEAYREMNANPPVDEKERSEVLKREIGEFRRRRKDMFEVFARRTGEMGTGGKMGQYRQLIALGCGVGLDQVDGVIGQLLEELEEREE